MKLQLYFLFIVIIFFATIIFSGCTTTHQTIYLQDIRVKGHVNSPPIHVTENDSSGTITVSPRISFSADNKNLSGKVEGHTLVNEQGVLQLDTVYHDGRPTYQISDSNKYFYEKDNFSWDMPDFTVGVDIDVKVSKTIALSMGFGFTNQDNISLIIGNLGIGMLQTKEDFSFRFELGLLLHQYHYTASTVVVTEVNPAFSPGYSLVTLYKDKGKEMYINPYLQLTYNTLNESMPVNFFISFGFFGQTLTDFEPDEYDPGYAFFGSSTVVEDTRGETYTSFINLSPGIFINLTEQNRLVLGARCLYELGFEDLSKKFFVFPFAQFDLAL